MRLITIPMSHYCEKARWGLDWAGLQWSEEAHLQVFHYRAVKNLDANGMVPVLVTDKEAVADSTAILQHLDKGLPDEHKLYPEHLREEIQDLEEAFDEELGIETRRWVYYHWMPLPSREVIKIAGQGIPRWQSLMAPFMFPMMRRFLAKHLSISDNNVQTGMSLVHKHFDAVAERLSDGRAFICGEQFTAADLSFACMAAPVLLPRQYGIRLPTPDEVPASARADVDYFRAHKAGQFALRLFAESRTAPLK